MKQPSGTDLIYGNSGDANALQKFLLGDVVGSKFTQVDLSLWDMATNCASCHVGGGLTEKDRDGRRLSHRITGLDGNPADSTINPYTYTVYEKWNAATGAPEHNVIQAPWAYNYPLQGKPDFKMPNVREMDCLFCHYEGYNNLMSSVFAQMGILNAAPAAGAGFLDLRPYSKTMGGYNPDVVFSNTTGAYLPSFVTAKIKPIPPSANCQQCHSPNALKDLPDMMSGFLSSAPMILNLNPANPMVGPTGLVMPGYDFNAPWLPTKDLFGNPLPPESLAYSAEITFFNVLDPANIFKGLLAAQGPTIYNASKFNPDPMLNTFIGGGNRAGSGPIYYEALNADNGPDQNVLKKSTVPFPRADWFKRGDAWQDGQDAHASLGCGGCHMQTNSKNPQKNQCDPGRGYDGAGGIQDGSAGIDTRNTVKRCEHCHLTGTNTDGKSIATFTAPNPTAAHQAAGLTAKITRARGLDGSGNEAFIPGDHMDVLDCTVCHVQKKSMAVRALDCTSGNRYPTMEGFDFRKGMMGMFEDPAPDAANEGARQQYNAMNDAINSYYGYVGGEAPGTPGAVGSPGEGQPGPGYQAPIPEGTHVIGGPLQEWLPLRNWSKIGNGNKRLTLYNDDGTVKATNVINPDWRRKIYVSNIIVSALWNNTGSSVDANGDGVPGQILNVGDENTTQGFGAPIFDPWIQRDLKAGMNFAPGGFAPIPVGFGGPGSGVTAPDGSPADTLYQSAYNADGTFTGAFKFVGVYGGNVIFTTPEEIRQYKNMRTRQAPSASKSWVDTELGYIGGPYQVTHGVKSTKQFALGKPTTDALGKVTAYGCGDCHATGKNFFDGGFNMTGTAIPADDFFTPLPGIIPATKSTVMERPAVFIPTIKGYKGDLRTGSELFNKLGQPRDVRFEESDATYTWTRDLHRGEALYPDADGYQKATGGDTIDRSQWLSYLLSLNNAGDFGIGVKPVAKINPIQDFDTGKAGIQVEVNKAVALSAKDGDDDPDNNPATLKGIFTYSWTFSGEEGEVTGKTYSKTFAATGTKTIMLKVMDEEGNVAQQYINVEVVAPSGISIVAGTTDATGTAFTFDNLPVPNAKVYVSWGDGSTQWISTKDTANPNGRTTLAPIHKYAAAGNKTVSISVYNSSGVKIGYKSQVVAIP